MQIPFHKSYTDQNDLDGVTETIKSGWLTMGPKTVSFEDKFKQEVKVGHAVAVNSCTAALHLALRVIDLKPGDEVIIPSMTFAATGEVVCYFGAKPVIADVDRDTHNIMVSEIERKITPNTKAIIPVHFAGQPADLDEINQLAGENHLKVIEDAAHCFPSYYKDQPIGGISDITAFSFYATKTIGIGEGGMATTNNPEWAEQMKILRLHGISKDAWKRYTKEGSWFYEVVDAGFKYNITDIQASLGLTQLAKAEYTFEKRRSIAERYNAAFEPLAHFITPVERPDRKTSWHLYVLKLNLESLKISRNDFIEILKSRGVNTSVHFIPMYRHPFYAKLTGVKNAEMPNSEWLFERIVSLPIFPGMGEDEVDYVIENVIKIARENAK